MNDDRLEERLQMVETQLKSRARFSEEILQAMREIPRHLFVPAEYQSSAYSDGPLPIEHGQTISQPFIVGLMASLLTLNKGKNIIRAAVINGPGMCNFCFRFLDEKGLPLKNLSISYE